MSGFNILYLTHFLNGFLMVAMPVGLVFYLTRKWHLEWRLVWIGGATFILSQVLHVPFNILILNPVVKKFDIAAMALLLGLSAGIFEELSRYAMYRWWAKDARSWREGLLLGAGHGGMEASLLGLYVLYIYLNLVIASTSDLSKIVPANQLDLALKQVAAYWTAPWYTSLLGAVERAFTIPAHLAMSLLVLQAFTRKKGYWVILAILWHTILDASSVYSAKLWGVYITEAIIGGFALVNIGLIFLLRQPEPPQPEEAPPLPLQPLEFHPTLIEATKENLDDSRYNY